jgi:hypothetical protein
MKTINLIVLILGFVLSMAPVSRDNFFQVISSEPHHLEALLPHVETVYKNGRLWVVRLKPSITAIAHQYVRPLNGNEKSYLVHSKISFRKSFNTNNEIESLILKVDREAIRKDVEELSSYQTRYAGSKDNQLAVEAAGHRLTSMGYEVQEICYRSGVCSLVADKKGYVSPDKVILVMGHIDSVGASYAGADDNGSGTAVLLEMARVLKDYNNKKTIRFFITNGEELGLLGAKHYAKLLASENKIKEIDLAINMDMVGYNANGVVELETSPKFEGLAKWFATLAEQYTTLKTKITLGAWGSDHVPFLDKGVPTLLTIENWDTKTPCYHMACDKPDTLNYDYAAEIGKLNISAVLTQDL